MPELPEVETVRRSLLPAMVEARIQRVSLRRADLRIPFPPSFSSRLSGADILALDRRGKFLIAPLSTGETLIMHLGMSGRFSVKDEQRRDAGADFYYAEPADPRHDHVVFDLENGGRRFSIIYNDARRFGLMDLAPSDRLDDSPHFSEMGPEPLDDTFTPSMIEAAMAARAAPIKTALLDQTNVAGLGNIYVCEALFRAGLSPKRRARTVRGAKAERLHAAIRAVLNEAIDAGGSTLRDFAASDGAMGSFQHRFLVYDRENQPCPCCGRPIRRFVQSGRSTYYCSTCQR
jgi:formamidopyrimidine-DNA glycosylase